MVYFAEDAILPYSQLRHALLVPKYAIFVLILPLLALQILLYSFYTGRACVVQPYFWFPFVYGNVPFSFVYPKILYSARCPIAAHFAYPTLHSLFIQIAPITVFLSLFSFHFRFIFLYLRRKKVLSLRFPRKLANTTFCLPTPFLAISIRIISTYKWFPCSFFDLFSPKHFHVVCH